MKLSTLLPFSAVCGLCLVSGLSSERTEEDIVNVTFTLNITTSLGAVLSRNLAALSIEFCYIIDYLGDHGAPNRLSYQLLQNIQDISGSLPLIRIGGHTQDVAQFNRKQSQTINNTFEPGNLEAVSVSFNADLFAVLNENVPNGQEFILGLNLGQDNISLPLAEILAAETYTTPDRIYAYELGNEPDFYGTSQRPGIWNIQAYVQQQENWLATLKSKILHASHGFQLGAFAQEPIYMGNFSLAEATKLNISKAVGKFKTYSDHTYPFSACTAETEALVSLPNLMSHSNTTRYFSQWSSEIIAAKSAGAKFVMGETGSVSCHGKDGISNTLGAAMWEIDYMLHGATLGMHAIHFHMGTPFFYSMWQPVAYNGIAARVFPTYYSLIFVAAALAGVENPVIYELLALESNDLALYALYDGSKLRKLIAINLEYSRANSSTPQAKTLDVSKVMHSDVTIGRLTGPNSETTNSEQVTWKGQSYSTGTPRGQKAIEVGSAGIIHIAASEAVIIEAF